MSDFSFFPSFQLTLLDNSLENMKKLQSFDMDIFRESFDVTDPKSYKSLHIDYEKISKFITF